MIRKQTWPFTLMDVECAEFCKVLDRETQPCSFTHNMLAFLTHFFQHSEQVLSPRWDGSPQELSTCQSTWSQAAILASGPQCAHLSNGNMWQGRLPGPLWLEHPRPTTVCALSACILYWERSPIRIKHFLFVFSSVMAFLVTSVENKLSSF